MLPRGKGNYAENGLEQHKILNSPRSFLTLRSAYFHLITPSVSKSLQRQFSITVFHSSVYQNIKANNYIETPMSGMLPISDMYNQVYRIKTAGIDGYDYQKKYQDPLKQIKDRYYLTQKKGQKSRLTVTDRGSYIKDQIKLTKNNPGPGSYKSVDNWPKASKTLREAPKKKTYLDEIIEHAKKEKLPAPGAYNLFKTQKEIDAEMKKLRSKKPGEKVRINYLDEVQYASNDVPGPGNYNPHEVQKQARTNKTKPEEWRQKSLEISKKKPAKAPDMGSYNPQPSFQLFSSPEHNKKTVKSVWGMEQRFDLAADPKKKGKVKSLGPGQYQLLHQWRGKNDKRNPKERDCFQATSKPMSKSVYY